MGSIYPLKKDPLIEADRLLVGKIGVGQWWREMDTGEKISVKILNKQILIINNFISQFNKKKESNKISRYKGRKG